ncbi:Tim44/TimA family putative adaptor protein [Henriciella marina]|uniref:Tim44/TimA family putative adaptor protein n=1 Tax=Henriciella marina TaxID=453851 RepID=A0ABT4LRK8_9PROT|nr:Tim44/TimA family putative adaptor protein [Henriciella marina]MCZ4296994.1 Tim44/TimA family putative adaptor protein [Henriciella marina]
MSSSMIELLLLTAIAVFVGWRLYTTLGSDAGPPEGRARDQKPAVGNKPATPARENPAGLRPAFTGPAASGLEAIHSADSSFNPKEFLSGARSAYEMLVKAFAEGDRETLGQWLDTDVYEAWDAAIAEREKTGAEAPQLLRLKRSEIDAADLDAGGTARVTVRFQSELGIGDMTRTSEELWTFMRDTSSDDPNWLLDDVDTP